VGLKRASDSRLAWPVVRAGKARLNSEIAEPGACRLAFGKAKNNKATKHVEACLETSRDGGSNPPASILRSPILSADENCYGIVALVSAQAEP